MDYEIKQNSLKAWILAARPKTLSAASIPVVVASALAYSDSCFHLVPALICLLFAWLMQIAANMINDLFDFLKGSDRSDRLGPERACAQGWISTGAMKIGIFVVLVSACMIGMTLLCYGGALTLISVGVTCVVFAFLYTTLLSYLGLGDILVLVFFGFVPVMGTYYVQSGRVSTDAVLPSLICGILIDTLLVLNNYRDRDTDRRDGKKTLVTMFGEKFGRYLYLSLGVVSWMLCFIYFMEGKIWAFLLPTIYLFCHLSTWYEMACIRHGKSLNGILGKTSLNMLLFAVLLVTGLVIS